MRRLIPRERTFLRLAACDLESAVLSAKALDQTRVVLEQLSQNRCAAEQLGQRIRREENPQRPDFTGFVESDDTPAHGASGSLELHRSLGFAFYGLGQRRPRAFCIAARLRDLPRKLIDLAIDFFEAIEDLPLFALPGSDAFPGFENLFPHIAKLIVLRALGLFLRCSRCREHGHRRHHRRRHQHRHRHRHRHREQDRHRTDCQPASLSGSHDTACFRHGSAR
ncbi:MAG: hypothetical protein JRG94_23000 [Deltaproteobacteria bacterium]|nr:hypothetical protein [Deltaproteobacteria bacterium]